MAELRTIYDEIMADLVSKGFGGLVQQLDHDYKNASSALPKSVVDTSYTENEKTKNCRLAAVLNGGESSIISCEVVH
jgi:hypothetical protein